MKKMLTFICFMTLIISSYSAESSNNTKITESIMLEENMMLVVPEDAESEVSFIIALDELEKDIYKSTNQIILTNEKDETLTLEDDIQWLKVDNQTVINITNSSKEDLISFFNSSKELDFQIFKTNTIYTLEDVTVGYFRI